MDETLKLDFAVLMIFIIMIGISAILKYIGERKQTKFSEINLRIDTFCDKHYKKVWFIFIVLLFITVVFKFGELPTYLSVDEAGMSYDSYCIANYGVDRYLSSYPLYLTNFGSGQSALCAYLAAFFVRIFGANIISYRLPMLFIYLLAVVTSYLFVSKSENKKVALLFTFLIITCPWNICSTRQALDCNLYAGMFMISLWLMERAKKNYQYILAGISIGITLYTYVLSWITMPIFLIVWIIYMLYLKRINIKQIILLGIPIVILAAPLIYFLLLNYGVFEKAQFGIFSLPILGDFRGEQFSISNIWKHGWNSIKIIFIYNESIYLVYNLLFIIGYIIGVINTIKSIKKKQLNATSIITIAFTVLFLGLLMVEIRTNNKANVLYIPILYFVSIAICNLFKYSRVLFAISIIAIFVSFIDFEYSYYTDIGINAGSYWYEDRYLYPLTKQIETNEEIKKMDKYVIVNRTSQYIYPLLATEISPYEFMETLQLQDYIDGRVTEVKKFSNYYFYSYYYNINEFYDMKLDNSNYLFIISKEFEDVCQHIEKHGYKKQEYGDLYVLTNINSNITINS